MDEVRPEPGRPPNLRVAMRRARAESAEQAEVFADLRQAEVARLELLEERVRPIIDQTPDDVELFDLGITQGDRPRLFLDMISFVDLAHDRRTYRFFQDTRHGRVLIAESENAERIQAAITNYVARRLVEREQALAADWRGRDAGAPKPTPATRLSGAAKPPPPRPRRRAMKWVGDAFGFLLMTIGSITLCVGLFLVAQAGWEAWGRAFWEAHLGRPPF